MVVNGFSRTEGHEGEQGYPDIKPPSLAHDLKNVAVLRTQDISTADDVDFKNLLLPDFILHGLEAANFQRPSPIQLRSIPLLRLGLDLIVQSKAGTGKTLVIALAALETVQLLKKRLQVVVVAPTREIAIQTKHFISVISSNVEVRTEVFIGGTSVKEDKKNTLGCQIAIGTPGRLNSLIETGDLSLNHIRLFVLDEADKLMEKSIFSQVRAISKVLPANKQTILCSATFLHPVKDYVMKHMKEPYWVTPDGASRLQPGNPEQQKSASTVLLGVTQFFKEVPNHPQIVKKLKFKLEEILDILSGHPFTQCMIFSNHQTRAESICHQLVSNGWPAMSVRGQDEQSHRTATLNSFKELQSRILLTTDVMSRGVDFKGVDLVINLDIPFDSSTYLHRMGRAGRFGSYGNVITLASHGEEVENFKKILSDIGDTTVFNLPSDLSLIKQESKLNDLFYGPTAVSAQESFESEKVQAQTEGLPKDKFSQESEDVKDNVSKKESVNEDYKNSSHIQTKLSKEDDVSAEKLQETVIAHSPNISDKNIVEVKKSFPKQIPNRATLTVPDSKGQTEMIVQTASDCLSKALGKTKMEDMTIHSFEELEKMCSDWIINPPENNDQSHVFENNSSQKDWWTSAGVVLAAARVQLQEIKEKASCKNVDQELRPRCHSSISSQESVSSTECRRNEKVQESKKYSNGHSKTKFRSGKDSRIHLQDETIIHSSGEKELPWLWDKKSKVFYMWDHGNAYYNLYNPFLKCYFIWEPDLDRYHRWDDRSQKYRLWDCDINSYCDSNPKESSVKKPKPLHVDANLCNENNEGNNYTSWFYLWNRHLQQMSWQVYQAEYLKGMCRK